MFTYSQTFQAKSHIFSLFDNISCLFVSQSSFIQIHVHTHVLLARILGKLEYVAFEFAHVHQCVVSALNQLDIYQLHIVQLDQLLDFNSIFLAIVIHSLFVIKWYHAPIFLQAWNALYSFNQTIGYQDDFDIIHHFVFIVATQVVLLQLDESLQYGLFDVQTGHSIQFNQFQLHASQIVCFISYLATQNQGWVKSALQTTGKNHSGQVVGAQ